MEDFNEMKPTELISLSCDLSQTNTVWSNQAVEEWRPSQKFFDLLTKIEQKLHDKLNITIWEVRVMFAAKKTALDNQELVNYKRRLAKNVTAVRNMEIVKKRMDEIARGMGDVNQELLGTHHEI